MSTSKKVVPEAKEALEKFKYEVASEVGVNLKNGYNGDIKARDASRAIVTSDHEPVVMAVACDPGRASSTPL